MSKYDRLWACIRENGDEHIRLTFDEIREITGIEIDHSFLNFKKELLAYGYRVGKISLKEKTVLFEKECTMTHNGTQQRKTGQAP